MKFETTVGAFGNHRYADQGSGSPVVLLHGFPDAPESWQPTVDVLVEAGLRAVVPYLRGYHPDTIAGSRSYKRDEIGEDIIDLLDTLNADQAVLVGHDFGASAAWSALRQAPDRVSGIVSSAIPHPASIKPSPGLLWQTRHFGYFKLPKADERTSRNDFAYIDELYDRWAPSWSGAVRAETIARAKARFADPEVLHHVLHWYRDLDLKPDSANNFRVDCPGLLISGGADFDGVVEAFERSESYFDGPSKLVVIEGAGHWPHREGEDQFHDELVNFVTGLPGAGGT